MSNEWPVFASRSFLARARKLLIDATPDGLLHAALDLRMGIEARYHEYLDAAEEITILKKRGWQVSKLAKDLERVYRTSERIISFALLDRPSGGVQSTWLYTPIRRHARKVAERLGDYLHYTKRFRPSDPKWRDAFTDLLQEGVKELEFATTGILLAPPLWHPATGRGTVLAEMPSSETAKDARLALGQPGETVFIRVEYLDELPTQVLPNRWSDWPVA